MSEKNAEPNDFEALLADRTRRADDRPARPSRHIPINSRIKTVGPLVFAESVHSESRDIRVHSAHRSDTNTSEATFASLQAKLDVIEARYQHLFNASNDSVFLIEASGPNAGKILDANDAAAQMHGYTHDELLQMKISDLDTAESAALVPERMRLIREHGSLQFEVEHRRRDGSVFAVEVSTRLTPIDGHMYLVAFNRDITERKKAERALRESEQRWKFAIEGAGDGLWDWDMQTNHVFFSECWKAMIGYSDCEIANNFYEWENRVHPDDKLVSLAKVKAHLEGKTPLYLTEHRMQCKDGSWKWILARGLVTSRDANGKATRMIGTHTDISEQKHAEQQLKESEERYRTLVDWTSESVFIHRNGRLLYVNPAAVRLFHARSAEELVGTSYLERIASDHRVLAKNREALLNAGDEVPMVELDLITTNGEVFKAEIRSSLVGYEGGPAIHSSIRDITARKAAEREFQSMTRMLERTGEMAKVGGWELDLQHMNLTWSTQTRLIHEIENEITPTVEDSLQFYAPNARYHVQTAIQNAIVHGTSWDLELPLITARSREIWVRTQGTAIRENGRTVRLIGAIQDITARKQSDAALRESEERLKYALDATCDGLWDWNIRSSRVYYSPQWARLIGYEIDEFPHTVEFFFSLLHPDDIERTKEAVERHFAGETPVKQQEIRIRTKSGQYRWFLDRGKVVERDENGAPSRMIGTIADITELRESQNKAEAASRAKSEFLANMSHEIRTPLTAILGFADLLRDDGSIAIAPEHRINTIDTIKNAGAHLLTVINDILDLSKIEADKMTIERVETSLVHILCEIESLLRPRALGKGIALRTNLSTAIPDRVLSDPTRLRQILMNLVGNAVKFTEVGHVVLTAATHNVDGNNYLAIEIEDTGVGLSPEQSDRLFTAFAQADNTVTRRHGGTGLGLTISRRLANLMGGDVLLVRTEPGKGSCFCLVLPIEATPNATLVSQLSIDEKTTTTPPRTTSIQLHGNILLAEDGIDNQRLIAFHLRKAGAKVDIADNGRIALEMIDEAAARGMTYDLLLTDMQMPEMDGCTLASTLRSRGSKIAIVALTAHAMAEDRMKCISSGCDDYQSKPIDRELLLSTCANWMSKPIT